MKLDLALRERHRAEKSLLRDLVKLSERHHAEHEIHHVARDLTHWSRDHLRRIADAGERYGLRLDAAPARTSSPLAPVRRKVAGVSLDWELVGQGAQAVKDADLLALSQKCHPQTLRQLAWTNTMLKTLSPQTLAS